MTDKEIIITYETLYELLRNEKYRTELQELNESFFDDVIKYLKEKKTILESQKKKDSIFAQTEIKKTKKQLTNIQKIIKDLYERRESKIIQLALFSSRTNQEPESINAMLPEEKKLFKNLVGVLNNYKKQILDQLFKTKRPMIKESTKPKEIKINKKETKLIRFLQEIQKFVGDDLNIYGPFKEGDIANLPIKVASLLIKKNKAEEIIPKDNKNENS